MFKFQHPSMIYLFALAPVLLILYYMMRRWKKQSIQKFGNPFLVQRLFPDVSVSRPGMKFWILWTGFILMVVGVCGPLIGSKLEEVKRKGSDIIICMDVSNSMNAEDIRPNRLERSKQAVSRLIDRLEGDRIGIVVFAGDAYMQLPITTDYAAAKLFLSQVETDIVPKQGTAIGAAIDMASTSFTDTIKKHSAIVVITDGENHEDDAIESAKSAAEQGIKVYTIGMGSASGAPIPIYNNGTRVGFRQDNSGATVISKLDQNMLNEIADAGKGRFIQATNSDDGLDLILKELNGLDKKEFKAKMYTDYENQFQYFLAGAFILLIIDFLLGEKKSKWFAKLNPFGVTKKEA
ncbi:MAG TPA: VWA domain-containing protein [Bacteroidia bacterium]|jgi:Ca-activated chloride channel family protein|nr:VWA domain-containing protein [Bacteroidia bacterium]